MPKTDSIELKAKSEKVMKLWEERANAEVLPAYDLESLALRDSLPDLLEHIVSALSTAVGRTAARKVRDRTESLRIGQEHGRERAQSQTYTMDQMILEYQILREVIFDVLEEDGKNLNPVSREIILSAIEQAVSDAATQFSKTLKDIQERIASSLTHDLRGPITAARLNSEMIIRKSDDAKFNELAANRICKCMVRLDGMISELLDASMFRSGRTLELEKEECDLPELVNESVEELNLIYNNRFKVLNAGPIKGCWNKSALRRILENLLTNAIKYGDQDKPVTITLQQDKTRIALIVHNDGEPIPEEEQKKLFKAYHRSKDSLKQKGWGLGLTVVKSLAEAHEGSVRVESEAGKGTSFIVEIPNH